jgi:hypothetical protein
LSFVWAASTFRQTFFWTRSSSSPIFPHISTSSPNFWKTTEVPSFHFRFMKIDVSHLHWSLCSAKTNFHFQQIFVCLFFLFFEAELNIICNVIFFSEAPVYALSDFLWTTRIVFYEWVFDFI